MKHKIVLIDVLRSLAALAIVLFHYTSRYCELTQGGLAEMVSWPLHIDWGYGAIATFFILSGFLVAGIFSKDDTGGVGRYLKKRFWRLYPTFWLCVVISTIALLHSGYAAVSLKTFLLNLTMIPNCLGSPYIDGAYWTMQMEFFFTLIVAVAIIVRRLDFKLTILSAWALLMLIFNLFEGAINNTPLRYLSLFVMPGFACYFIAGIAVRQIVYGNRRRWLFVGLLTASTLSAYLVDSFGPMFVFYVLTVAILLCLRIIEPALERLEGPAKVFSFLAIVSYPFYLLHQYIGYEILDWLAGMGITTEVAIVIPIAAILLLASAIHLYFERLLPTK